MRKFAMITMASTLSFMIGSCIEQDITRKTVTYPIQGTNGQNLGTLAIAPLKDGGVEVDIQVSGLTPGSHAMHFHEFGRCDGPDFKSAGGHYNPTQVAHGDVEDGPHAGDMMNIDVDANGKGQFKVTHKKVSLTSDDLPALLDKDGTALILHAGPDDYESQPSGAAGPRVACAAIR